MPAGFTNHDVVQPLLGDLRRILRGERHLAATLHRWVARWLAASCGRRAACKWFVGEMAAVHQLLGRGWQRGGQPVTERDVRIAIAQQSPIMRGLDLIDDTDWHAWAVGASARSLLPRADMLAEISTNDA